MVQKDQIWATYEKDALLPVAQIVTKKDTCVLGLQNKTKMYWDAISAKGITIKVAPKRVI